MFSPYEGRAQGVPSPALITPHSFAPAPPEPVEAGFAFGDNPTTNAPQGAQHAYLIVNDFRVEGLDPDFRDEIEPILTQLRRVRAEVTRFYEAAARIQAVYARHGLFLTRVVIPPQHVTHGGKLTLRVIHGFLQNIDVQRLAPAIRDRVARTLAPLIERPMLTQAEFERALLLAAGSPGLVLKSRLTPAPTGFGVELIVTGAYHVVDGQASIDNAMPHSLGGLEATTSTTVNSALSLGEQIYFSAGGSVGYGGFTPGNPHRLAAAGAVMPVGSNGLSLNFEYAWSTTNPEVSSGQIATNSLFQRLTWAMSYPYIESETDRLVARVAFDDLDEANQASDFHQWLYHDHLSVARIGLDASHIFPAGGQLSAGAVLSQGLPGFGARGAAQATFADPVSRSGASDQFTKLEAHARFRQELPSNFSLEVSGQGQYAISGPLMNAEKYSLGGPTDLSGYDSGYFSGDSGWTARSELQYTTLPTGPKSAPRLTPYMFAAHGAVYTLQPSMGQTSALAADSFGLGLRAALLNSPAALKPASFGIEFARNIAEQTSAAQAPWRFNFSAAVSF